MNKIEKLIKELCPNGVEWKKLGEVCTIVRGASPRPIQKFLTKEENGVAWIKIGDATPGSKFITSCEEKITKEGSLKSRLVHKGDFILSNSMSFGRPFILGIDGCIHDGWIAMSDFKKIALPDYFYYMLLTEPVQNYWAMKANSGGAVSNLNADIVRSTPIPLPPLPIQTEIVRILDKFVEQQEQLERLIELRKKQYEYYREEMLKPKEGEVWERKAIGELLEFKNGLNASKDQFGHGNPIVNYVNVYKKRSIYKQDLTGLVELDINTRKRYDVKKGDVFFTRTSETLEEIGYASVLLEDVENGVFSGFVLRGRPVNNMLYPEYCKYCFSTKNIRMQIQALSTMTTRALTNGKSLSKVKICLPYYDKQKEIADALDSFESSIATLTSALEASKKRYEYYRDEVMRFLMGA